MKALWSGLLTLLLLASCGGLPFTHSATPDSGIDGIVIAWPTCAVEVLASPCPESSVQADVRVGADGLTRPPVGDALGQGPLVAEVRSDASGRFRVALAPGSYVVEAVPPSGTTLTPKPITVVVPPHEFAQVTVLLDTGIR
jgi:hypothetical protein